MTACRLNQAASKSPRAWCCMQIDLVKGMMDCLYAECKPCITDCVIAELEKLGQRYRVALKVAKVGPTSQYEEPVQGQTPGSPNPRLPV